MAEPFIPDPPVLPGEINPDGLEIPDYWEIMADMYAARLNPITKQFDVRGYDNRIPGGKLYPTDFDAPIRFGPPGQRPDWHPILEKFGLQVLEQAGFINGAVDGLVAPLGRLAGWHADGTIHPVLREEMWTMGNPSHYQIMLPVLHLVSAVLDDPDTLRFFASLMDQPSMEMARTEELGNFYVFKSRPVLSEQECKEVYQKLVDMRTYCRWNLEVAEVMADRNCYGDTGPLMSDVDVVPGVYGFGTTSSWICISDAYVRHIREAERNKPFYEGYLYGIQGPLGVESEKRIRPNVASAVLRTMFMMANTILHEFTHAVTFAHFPVFPNDKGIMVREPFYQDMRLSEAGLASETHIFGGMVRPYNVTFPPLCYEDSLIRAFAAAFGFYFEPEFSKFWIDDGSQASLRARRAPDWTPHQFYPVHQSWVTRMWSRQLWNDEVYRFGMGAVRVPRLDKWRVDYTPSGAKGQWGTGGKRWNEGPVIGETPDPFMSLQES